MMAGRASRRLAVVRGSGNAFRDFGYADADAEHLKAVLAAQIINLLDNRKLTVRAAGDLTGMAAADLRQAKLNRFTVDRLMAMLAKLDRTMRVQEPPLPEGL